MAMLEAEEYPMYPCEDSTTGYAAHMRSVTYSIEQWLFEQATQLRYRIRIGSDVFLSKSFQKAKASRSKSVHYSDIKSVVDIILKMAGRDFELNFSVPMESVPDDDLQRVTYAIRIYHSVIYFLKNQGALMEHVTPFYLLSYDDYLIFYKQIQEVPFPQYSPEESMLRRTRAVLDEESFCRVSKQCWLDLYLQLYKVLVLWPVYIVLKGTISGRKSDRVVAAFSFDKSVIIGRRPVIAVSFRPLKKYPNQRLHVTKHDFIHSWSKQVDAIGLSVLKPRVFCLLHLLKTTNNYSTNKNLYIENPIATLDSYRSSFMRNSCYKSSLLKPVEEMEGAQMSKSEHLLLNWLNYVYETKRNSWNKLDPKLGLPARKIKNFTKDLQDAVVLTACTMFYCPYLTKELGEFYFRPSTFVEYQHNAIVITQIWRSIRLGLSVESSHFQAFNQVSMIIMVTHLYLYLTSYVPIGTLALNACLSSSNKKKITLVNPATRKIKFQIVKIGDPNDYFSFSKRHISITAKKSKTISAFYTARKLFEVKCVVVLCGSCQAGNFATNMVFELEGEPSKFDINYRYRISVPIYKPAFVTIKCTSPYPTEAIYEIWYTEKELEPGNIVMRNWKAIKDRKLPRSLYIACTSLVIPSDHDNNPAEIPLAMACFTSQETSYWLIFTNEKIGDFIVKLTIEPTCDYHHAVYNVDLPYSKCMDIPVLMCASACPRLMKITIPIRNWRFWETLKTMLYFTLNDQEKEFWAKHLETTIGITLIQWMIGDKEDSECNHLFSLKNSKINYTLECDSPLVEIPPTFLIPDIFSPGNTEIPLHIRSEVDHSFSATVTMKSEDETEIRVFRVNFNIIGEEVEGRKSRFSLK